MARGLLMMAAVPALCATLASCGGGGGGGGDDDDGRDPTVTTYAPQTLDGLELQLSRLGGTGIFVFTQTVRTAPETENGTFVYFNNSTTDVFANTIINGTYTYRVELADRGDLILTGGEGTGAAPASLFVGTLTNTEIELDFSPNSGNSSTFVDASTGFTPVLALDGIITVNGVPLPLNYNGSNGGKIVNPNVPTTIHLTTFTFTDSDSNPRVIEFTRIGGPAGQEIGTFAEVLPPASPLNPLEGTYFYTPDLTGDNTGALDLTDTELGIINLNLTYSSITSGTSESLDAPFADVLLPFTFE